MPWQTERPRPVPAPTGLVVKKGSSTRLRSAAGTPGPLSATSTRTTPGPAEVRSHSRRGGGTVLERLLGVDHEVQEHLAELVLVGHRRRQVAASSRTISTPALRRP